MKDEVLKIENLSKIYRLGEIGTGTISQDLNTWYAKLRGKQNPNAQISQVNDRTQAQESSHVYALKDIDFSVRKGEVLGIIGRNGAGKSTLLKVISRITSPTTGSIKAKGRMASLLEVGTGMHEEMTARENIYLNGAILGMRRSEINQKFDAIIDFAGCNLYVDTPVKRFSSGMRVRLGFAVAAFLEPEILVIDEVLAVGDADFQKKCITKMKEVADHGRTILFVSHNMASVRSLCTRGLVLENGMLALSGSVEESVSYYINSNLSITKEDEIIVNVSDQDRLYSTPGSKFTKCEIFNSENKLENKLFFREKFKVNLSFETNSKLESVSFTVRIVSSLGEVVAFAASEDMFYTSSNLEEGSFNIELDVVQHLMPGRYFLTFSAVNTLKGSAIDYVEHFYPFTVRKETKSNNFEYPWATVHGYIELEPNWNITKK